MSNIISLTNFDTLRRMFLSVTLRSSKNVNIDGLLI